MTEVTAIFNFSILISATTDDKPFSHPPATENMTLNLNDDSFIQQLDFYLSGIILLLVCLLGLICNLLVVVVLTHRSMRSSTNSFLLSLAIFDSMVLLCTTFLICFPPLSSTYTKLIFPHIVAYIYPLALLAQTCTIWITVSFTVERYIAVTHPLKASSMCTIKRARLTTVLVVTIAVLYNACRWFEYRSVRVFITDELNNTNLVLIPNTKLPTFRVQPTMLEQNKIYETVYFSVLYLTVMCIVPILLLGTLNTFLILAVRRSQKERRNMSTSNTSKENNITIMLVSVVVVFIICQVPALIYSFAYGINKPLVIQSQSWQVLSILRNFTVTLNSAINFILYCAFGQKFRRVFLRVFCKKLTKDSFRSVSERTAFTTNGSSSVHMPMIDKNSNSTKYTHAVGNGDTIL